MFDAVDTRVDEARQRVLTEDVRRDAGAVGMRRVDGVAQHVVRPERSKIADLTVDPVPHQLDPAVPAAGLLGHRVGQL